MQVIRNFPCFSSHNQRKFPFDKRRWIENGEGFAIHSSTSQIVAKGEYVSPVDWRYRTQVEKLMYFFTCVVTVFLRARNLCITPQLI